MRLSNDKFLSLDAADIDYCGENCDHSSSLASKLAFANPELSRRVDNSSVYAIVKKMKKTARK